MYDRDQSVKTELNFHKEAADFYGMYRRGVDPDRIRADITVPDYVVDHWRALAAQEDDITAREALRVMVPYRERVLARFDALVAGAGTRACGPPREATCCESIVG